MQVGQRSFSVEGRERTVSLELVLVLAGGGLLLDGALHELVLGGSPQAAAWAWFLGGVLLSAPILWLGVKGLLGQGSPTDVLVGVAVAAALLMEDYAAAGLVSFFMLLGALVEERTALGAREAIESLVKLTPNRARLLTGDGEREVDASGLEPGQLVRVRPGDLVPADGLVRKGWSAVDQASITGESVPAEVAAGSTVFAGSTNLSGMIEVEVTRAGENTALGRVQSLVAEAESAKAPIYRLVDTYAKHYTPFVLTLAAGLLAFTGDVTRAMSALIVGCPCALVIATPTACVAALACAARMGILIKSVRHLEVAATVDTVVFDKTGTLTTGKLAVALVVPSNGMSEDQVLLEAACAVRHSSHPVARAVVDAASRRKLVVPEPEDFEEVGGLGSRCTGPGTARLAGRRSFLQREGVTGLPAEDDAATATGSRLELALDGAHAATIHFEDSIRDEALWTGQALLRLECRRTIMLTGDRRAVAERVAIALGCTEVHAELVPEDKLRLVKELQRQGHRVAVVGDGVNDAPALAAGDLGVAVGDTGSDVAIKTADVVLLADDLSRFPKLLSLARQTRRTISQNLSLAVGSTVVALILASGGYLTPVGASVVHNTASVLVALNAVRLLRHDMGPVGNSPA